MRVRYETWLIAPVAEPLTMPKKTDEAIDALNEMLRLLAHPLFRIIAQSLGAISGHP
ncbi:MAG: hypothetical protein IJS54_06220 [Desulfovibrio sp.]|nr:hypothetical protein [Desulfovibrio sp.]